jgi:tricarballylate dehydrogenase
LTNILVQDAADTIRWLHHKGLRFRLMYDRQSFEVDGRHQFWAGWRWGRWTAGED